MHQSYMFNSEQYSTYSQQWIKILKRFESICIIFPYYSDLLVRMEQLSQDLKAQNIGCPLIMEPQSIDYENFNDFESSIAKLVSNAYPNLDLYHLHENQKVILIIPNGDTLLSPTHHLNLEYAHSLARKYLGNLTHIISVEQNIFTKPDVLKNYPLLFQNTNYYPLYSKSDTLHFLNFLCQLWDINPSSKILNEVLGFTNGSFWLAKQAMRNLQETAKFDPTEPSFHFRINSLVQRFSSEEIELILNPKSGKVYRHSQLHLQKSGFIDSNNNFKLPHLLPLLQQKFSTHNHLLIHDSHFMWNQADITHLLSAKERNILTFLVHHPNTPISREKLAPIIWPVDTDEKYSEWAIDQTIKRLRDKISKIGLPPTIIKSIRGVGYEYRSTT